MAFAFDGPNRLIVLSTGTVAMPVPGLYSAWKDWVSAGNAQYLPAFSSVGGDPIDATAGTSVPFYDFLLNGWRIRPQEASHTLNVTGGILLVDGGGDPFVDTLGGHTVRINYQQPVQAITATFSTGSGVTAQDKTDITAMVQAALVDDFAGVPAGVWQRVIEGTLTAEQMQRIGMAALAGTMSKAGDTLRFKSVDGLTDRIVGTVDATGNRTSVTLNGG